MAYPNILSPRRTGPADLPRGPNPNLLSEPKHYPILDRPNEMKRIARMHKVVAIARISAVRIPCEEKRHLGLNRTETCPCKIWQVP